MAKVGGKQATPTYQRGDGDHASREQRAGGGRVIAMLEADATEVAEEGEVYRDEDLELGADREEVLDALLEWLVVGVDYEALELEEHGQVELEHRVHLRGSGEW